MQLWWWLKVLLREKPRHFPSFFCLLYVTVSKYSKYIQNIIRYSPVLSWQERYILKRIILDNKIYCVLAKMENRFNRVHVVFLIFSLVGCHWRHSEKWNGEKKRGGVGRQISWKWDIELSLSYYQPLTSSGIKSNTWI